MRTTALESKLSHDEALLESFGGSMDGWSYTGVVTDAGAGSPAKCGCGHAIRYEFLWAHEDGRTNVTGSVCVDNAEFISPDTLGAMKADLAALKAKKAADRRAAKLAAESAEVVKVVDRLHARIEESRDGKMVREWADVWGWVDYAVYNARKTVSDVRREMRRALLSLKTPKGQLRALAALEKAMEPEGYLYLR